MRVILAGQRSFGLAAYKAILEAGHWIESVWSPNDPDDKLTQYVKRIGGKWEPPVGRTWTRVGAQDVDLFVAAHSHDFIGRASRQATRLGGIGYHPSLLPRHRGRDAVRWTVHMGDPIAGGSVYWLTDNVDGGPIAAQDWCFVPRVGSDGSNEAVSELWRGSLFPMGIRLLLKVLAELDAGVMVEIPQDEAYATWEPSWERPPLHRPELPQLGSINGMKHVTRRWERGELTGWEGYR